MIPNPCVQQGKRPRERLRNERVHLISKTIPDNSDHRVFAETRATAYRLKNTPQFLLRSVHACAESPIASSDGR